MRSMNGSVIPEYTRAGHMVRVLREHHEFNGLGVRIEYAFREMIHELANGMQHTKVVPRAGSSTPSCSSLSMALPNVVAAG